MNKILCLIIWFDLMTHMAREGKNQNGDIHTFILTISTHEQVSTVQAKPRIHSRGKKHE